MTDDEFKNRLEKSKICVIGASNIILKEKERWEKVDPNYIGITGNFEHIPTIYGDSNFNFNFNNEPKEWIKKLFLDSKKNFDTLYIDRGTLKYMELHTIHSLFFLLFRWIEKKKISINTIMIPSDDMKKIYDVNTLKIMEKNEANENFVKQIRSNYEKIDMINNYIEYMDTEISIADVKFSKYKFKENIN